MQRKGKSGMKKKKFILLISVLLIFAAGCENKISEPSPSVSISPSPTPSVSPNDPQESEPPVESASPLAPDVSSAPSPEATSPTPEDTLLSSYRTKIMDHGDSRMKNLKLATKAIDGTILKSGEEFSFNAVVGERTKERGYEKAITYVYGEKTEDYGGGICQISTTLYNAALEANMDITERHEHRVEVPYIEKGKDATVDYENLDFKFKNPFDYSVIIAVTVNQEEVFVTISKQLS